MSHPSSQDPFGYSEQLSVHLDSEEGEKNLLEVVTGRKIGEREKIAEEVREKAKLTLRKVRQLLNNSGGKYFLMTFLCI